MTTDAPDWFRDAVATPWESRWVVADTADGEGVRVHYRAWGEPGDQLVVLLHGGAAHSGWWDHVAPYLADGHRVVALDLSGHGDSGWRTERYTLESWADEVMAVAAAESDHPPVVFGHSMGGFVALTAARDHGEHLRAVAAIDSPVQEMSPETRARLASNPEVPQHKVRPDRDGLVARFRTLPADDAGEEYVKRHVAEQSVREVDGGWSWKFDPGIFLSTRMEPEALAGAACDVALVRGERGMATRDITDGIRERLGADVPVVLIPDTGHHIMLDQPIAMIAVLQTLLSQWRTR